MSISEIINVRIISVLASAVFVVFILILNHSRKTLIAEKSQYFTIIGIDIAASAVFDAVNTYLIYYTKDIANLKVYYMMLHFSGFCYFFVHNIMTALFFLYILESTGILEKNKKFIYLIYMIPFYISQLLIILSYWNGWVYKYSIYYHYSRGPLLWLIYVISMFYAASSIFVFLRYRDTVSKEIGRDLISFILIAFCGALLQGIVPISYVEILMETVAFGGLFYTVEDERSLKDSVTECYNMKAFEYNLAVILDEKDETVADRAAASE